MPRSDLALALGALMAAGGASAFVRTTGAILAGHAPGALPRPAHAAATALLRPAPPAPPVRASRAARGSAPGACAWRAALGIEQLPLGAQAAVFAGSISAITAGGLLAAGPGLDAVERVLPPAWFRAWSRSWPLLGALYVLAGTAHFSSAAAFEAIYPPAGTWGLWYLPGSAAFHVWWTGVAEVLGGLGLLLGGLADLAPEQYQLPDDARFLTASSALGLCVLTLAVTPANIYMFTHDAQMVGLGPASALPVSFHAARGAVQVLLLGLLLRMAGQESGVTENQVAGVGTSQCQE